MTRTIHRPLSVRAAMLIAAMLFVSSAQAGAPTLSPIPTPRPQSKMACDSRAVIIAKLNSKYGETWRGAGLSGPTALFEIWASDATGTWTILKTTPNGFTCIMAVGDGWHDDAGGVDKIAVEGA